jgi:hypothetical protein
MNIKFKKTILSLSVLLATQAYSNEFVTIISSEEVSYISGKSVETTEWANNGGIYGCETWSPTADTVNYREKFTQNRDCSQDQTRQVNTYIVDKDGNKTLDSSETEHKTITVSESQQEIGTFDPRVGYIIALDATAGDNSQYDVTRTDVSTWEDHFGQTHDIVINAAVKNGITINNTGVINWFNPNKVLYHFSGEGCDSRDYAHNDIEYLDENDNIVFYTGVRSYGSFGSSMYYGKANDKSDITQANWTGPYPAVHGRYYFDEANQTVNFNHIGSTNYINSWGLTNVDVSRIRKIRLSYSRVFNGYEGGTCGAAVRLLIED